MAVSDRFAIRFGAPYRSDEARGAVSGSLRIWSKCPHIMVTPPFASIRGENLKSVMHDRCGSQRSALGCPWRWSAVWRPVSPGKFQRTPIPRPRLQLWALVLAWRRGWRHGACGQSRGEHATNGTLRLNRARWAERHEQQARKERRRASQPILYPFASGLRDRGAVELLTCMRRQPIDCGSVSARRESQTLPFHLRGIMQRPGSHNVFSAAVQFGQSCRGDRLP